MPSTRDWYYVGSSGKEHGPISEAELLRLLRNGTLSRSTRVRFTGMHSTGPLRAESIPYLVSRVPALAPPAAAQRVSRDPAQGSSPETPVTTVDVIRREDVDRRARIPWPRRAVGTAIATVLGVILFFLLAGISFAILGTIVAFVMPLFIAAMWLAEIPDTKTTIGAFGLLLLALISLIVGYAILF